MMIGSANKMIPDVYTIDSIHRENHDTFTLALRSQSGATVNSFLPGQFNMLYIFGVGEVPISISGDPASKDIVIHTTRSVGTVTGEMQKLECGDSIGLRGPYGSAWPMERIKGADLLIVAGGLGLAPLRSVIYQVISEREQYGNVTILYGTRSPDDIIFSNELSEWERGSDIDVVVTVDHAVGHWHGKVGVVTTLIPEISIDPENTMSMICGPEIMMKYTVSELQKAGIDENDIYVSLERNMKCAVGLCGRCQYGPEFICKDGPVFSYSRIKKLLRIKEL